MSKQHKDGQENCQVINLYSASIPLETMRLTAVLEPTLVLAIIISFVLSLYAVFMRTSKGAWFFPLLLALAAAGLLILNRYYIKNARAQWFPYNCQLRDHAQLAEFLHIEDNGSSFSSQLFWNGTRFRISVIDATILDSSTYKQLKTRIKKQMPRQDGKIPLYSAGNYGRIDIFLCQKVDEGFLEHMVKNMRHLLDRSECMFQAVYCREKQTFYIPDIFDGLNYSQVKRYSQFLQIVSCFVQSGNDSSIK